MLHRTRLQQTEFLSHKTIKTAHANREVVCVCRKWMVGMLLSCLLLTQGAAAEDYIHWVDFDVPVEALETAMALDIESQGKEKPLDWVEILALAATRNGSGKVSVNQVRAAAKELEGDASPEQLLGTQAKYYRYYREAYGAVLDGLVGQLCHPKGGWKLVRRIWAEGILPGCRRLGLFPLSGLWKQPQFWLPAKAFGQ